MRFKSFNNLSNYQNLYLSLRIMPLFSYLWPQLIQLSFPTLTRYLYVFELSTFLLFIIITVVPSLSFLFIFLRFPVLFNTMLSTLIELERIWLILVFWFILPLKFVLQNLTFDIWDISFCSFNYVVVLFWFVLVLVYILIIVTFAFLFNWGIFSFSFLLIVPFFRVFKYSSFTFDPFCLISFSFTLLRGFCLLIGCYSFTCFVFSAFFFHIFVNILSAPSLTFLLVLAFSSLVYREGFKLFLGDKW